MNKAKALREIKSIYNSEILKTHADYFHELSEEQLDSAYSQLDRVYELCNFADIGLMANPTSAKEDDGDEERNILFKLNDNFKRYIKFGIIVFTGFKYGECSKEEDDNYIWPYPEIGIIDDVMIKNILDTDITDQCYMCDNYCLLTLKKIPVIGCFYRATKFRIRP